MQLKHNNFVEIIYLPHATTFDNENNIATGTAEVAISPLGKEQIRNTHAQMAHEMLDKLFCSDSKRAIETAQGIFGDRYEITIDDRLREIGIGSFSGKSTKQTAPLQKQYVTTPWPQGESYTDIEVKIKDFLAEISARYNGQKIAIIGHQATQLAIEVLLHKLTWEQAIDADWRNTGAFQYGWRYTT